MKHRLLVFRQKWQVPFHLCAALLPAPLLLGAYAGLAMPYLACGVAAVYVIASLIALILPDRIRLACGAVGIALILFLGFTQVSRYKSPAMVLSPLLYAWLLIETLPLYGRDARDEVPPHVFVLGIVLHLAGQLAVIVTGLNQAGTFDAVKPGLSAAFVCFFLLSLLNFSRINLIFVAAMEKSVPRHIYRFNRVLTLALAALTLILGCTPAIVRFIKKLWFTAVRLIADLIAWLNSLLPALENTGDTEASGPREPMLPMAESEPGLLAKILEIVLYALVAAAAVAAVWLAVKYVKRFVKWLWKRFQEYAAANSTGDYIDEISDTRDDGERRRIFGRLQRKKDPLRGINPRKLPPAQRIRFYYLRLLLGHKDWKHAATARETLPAAAASIYERARYSTGELTQQDADAFLHETHDI